ncbi:Variant surface glycoprotein [Trypanosoma congolense IL3000]|uniref:Variant surface glycoprotein n=1 Tax=Trypanosoma congolense (strain IL3000) TaxID=1068625 RepID=F9WB56_TRYCI|nr:Variant surface glycoprotein [Trypanosoma congolense IL3000]
MECFVRVIAVVIFNLLVGVKGQGQVNVQGVDNAEQFALLCRIYDVAKNPPIHHVDSQDPLMIVSEIDALNASFAYEKHINETENVGNSSDAQVKPTITREAAVAQAILSRITKKANAILREIIKVNTTRDIEKVKADFAQVIFGEGGNESDLDKSTLSAVKGRAEACGNSELSNKGDSAGENIVVDFFCLCTQRTNNAEGIDNVCGVQVGGKSKGDYHGWSDAAPSGSASMWASMKKGCGNLLHQPHKFIEESYEVVEDFLKHLKTGGVYRWGSGKDSDRKPGMLGTGVGSNSGNGKSPVCDGKKGGRGQQPPSGVCVYYGTESEWETNIPWLKQLKTALDNLAILNNQIATIQRDIEKLHMLLHRAEEIYETANVITEIQRPIVPPNLQSAAKRLTAYSAARRYHPYHFILLWVLL